METHQIRQETTMDLFIFNVVCKVCVCVCVMSKKTHPSKNKARDMLY